MRLAVVLLLVLVGRALAALVSCDTCGAFNAPDAVRCAVCGNPVKKAAASPSPKASPSPAAAPAAAPVPPEPVPSVKSVSAEPVLPDPPEPAESPEPAPSPVTSPSAPPSPASAPEPRERDTPDTGTLVLDSEPEGATVRVRGKTAGSTPFRRTLDEGTYRVVVSAPGYVTERLRLRVRGGATLRRTVTLDRDPSEEKLKKHEDHLAPPSPAPRGPSGTLSVELVKYGEHTTAAGFEVELDGAPAGQGKLASEGLSSRLVRTFRYQRTVPPGPHTVRLSLLGASAVNKNGGSLQEASREFEIQVAPGRTTTLFHTWAGGIEDFARPHACCTRGHRRP